MKIVFFYSFLLKKRNGTSLKKLGTLKVETLKAAGQKVFTLEHL